MSGDSWAPFLLGLSLPPALYLLGKAIGAVSRPTCVPDHRVKPLGENNKVVITGSSAGLGRALAERFLEFGDDVMITSRSHARCEAVAKELQQKFPEREIEFCACDVRQPQAVEKLADAAKARFGRISIWVNNAGVSSRVEGGICNAEPDDIQRVVETNLLGSMYGCRAAIRVMAEQDKGGKVVLMDGIGARGQATPNNAAYGATKRALTQLKDSLAKEVAKTSTTVHIVSPGMVATELLLPPGKAVSAHAAWWINVLTETPAAVAAFLVPRIRGKCRNASYVSFLTPAGVFYRVLTSSKRKGRFVPVGGTTSGS